MIAIIILIGEVATALAAAFGIPYSIYRAIKHLKNNKIKKRRYYIASGKFTDRKESTQDLFIALEKGNNLINVFGKRGIGKSSFLKYFCDIINHKLDKSERIKVKTTFEIAEKPNRRKFAIYIELSGFSGIDITKQIVTSLIGDDTVSLSKAIERVIKQTYFLQQLILVIDNVNNAGLARALEPIIDIILGVSPKIAIIIGSILKHPLLNALDNSHIHYIQLLTFTKNDIYEFAINNNKSKSLVDTEYVNRVLDFSEGLPVFISLFFSEKSSNRNEFTKLGSIRINEYINRLVSYLDIESFNILQYIALLSITSATIKIGELRHFCPSINKKQIILLEMNSLIEFNPEQQEVKMHEIIRNHINANYIIEMHDKILNVLASYEDEKTLFEQTYYILLLGNTSEKSNIVIDAINKAVSIENYSFLILLGEHFKQFDNAICLKSQLTNEVFLYIVWGYLQGLIGVGDYPAARYIIEAFRITVRPIKTTIHFSLGLLVAKLQHLQNNYQESIATYLLLLDASQNDFFDKNMSKCYWGIAHSYRHEGKDYISAINYYDKAIEESALRHRFSEEIKYKIEKTLLLAFIGYRYEAFQLFDTIILDTDNLPIDKYAGTRIDKIKCEARLLSRYRINDGKSLALFDKVLNHYVDSKKRLQYNVFFDIGDLRRRMGDYEIAYSYFYKGLQFSLKNNDHNLETMSTIGIILCKIGTTSQINPDFKEAIIMQLIDLIEICERYNLYQNKLTIIAMMDLIQYGKLDELTLSSAREVFHESKIKIYSKLNLSTIQNIDLFLA